MAKILVVENDLFLLATLVNYLSINHEVHEASSLKKALKLFEKNNYDLVLTDRVLDDGDGTILVEELAKESFHTRIIILSKKSSVQDRVEGLSFGADDYLIKPFSLGELGIKIAKLLDKIKVDKSNLFSCEKISLRTDNGEVKIGSNRFLLSYYEVNILYHLLNYKERVLSRSEIINFVWKSGDKIPSEKTIDVYILRIRRKLGSYSKLIGTKRGFGYYFSDAILD